MNIEQYPSITHAPAYYKLTTPLLHLYLFNECVCTEASSLIMQYRKFTLYRVNNMQQVKRFLLMKKEPCIVCKSDKMF